MRRSIPCRIRGRRDVSHDAPEARDANLGLSNHNCLGLSVFSTYHDSKKHLFRRQEYGRYVVLIKLPHSLAAQPFLLRILDS